MRGLAGPLVTRLCRWEYEAQQFSRLNERPVEFAFVFRHLTRLCPGTVLDVGAGNTSLPHIIASCGCVVTATDNIEDYWPGGMRNRHFHVIRDDITHTRLTERYDVITCASVLQHVKNHDAAVASMFGLLRPGGHLIITCPYNESCYVPDVYRLEGAGYGRNNPYICQMYSRREVDRWFQANGGRLVEQEYWQFFAGPFWTFGEPLSPARKVEPRDRHQWTCLLAQKCERNR